MRQGEVLGLEDMVFSYKGGHGDSVHHREKKPRSMPGKREGVRNTRSPSLWLLGLVGDTEPTLPSEGRVQSRVRAGNGDETFRGLG